MRAIDLRLHALDSACVKTYDVVSELHCFDQATLRCTLILKDECKHNRVEDLKPDVCRCYDNTVGMIMLGGHHQSQTLLL